MLPYATLAYLAHQLGIAAVGVSSARALDEARPHLEAWLAAGHHGEMAYMQRNLDKRLDPRLLVPGARSIVSALVPYPPRPHKEPGARIASYAYCPDYHKTVKNTLFRLWQLINEQLGPTQGRVFVDSAPLLDRFWACNAGLGWIGRNTLLIHPALGSYFFIGSLVPVSYTHLRAHGSSAATSAKRSAHGTSTDYNARPNKTFRSRSYMHLAALLKEKTHSPLRAPSEGQIPKNSDAA